MGERLTKRDIEKIEERLKEYIPNDFIPQVVYVKEYDLSLIHI